ncbi:unnamed protein product [Meganyctiphanes norvegica]|uniref:Nephrin n=1 Tax=Meganyctiphanes norvegica TaxID=48144 RepID=A0AAV2QX78_MEGNR
MYVTSSVAGGSQPIRALCFLLLFLLFMDKCVGQRQRFRERPESAEVNQGDDVLLRCIVEHQQGNAQWTKDGFALGFERHVPGYPRYSYSGDSSRGQHHLVISGVTLEDDGEYQCQVGPTLSSPAIWAGANVTVLMAPTNISIVGFEDNDVVEVVEGSSLTLECLVENARPQPQIVWYRDGSPVIEGIVDYPERSPKARRWNLRSRLHITGSSEDDGKQYSCQALHPALHASPYTLVASITLSVLHPPEFPVISGYKEGNILVSGEAVSLKCLVRGGNPQPSVQWYRNGKLQLHQKTRTVIDGLVNTLQLNVEASDDKATYECRMTHDLLERPASANTSLQVNYGPASVRLSGPTAVREGQPISLTCSTSAANPAADIVWYIEDKVLEGVGNSVSANPKSGWNTTSRLDKYMVTGLNMSEVPVECRAVSPVIKGTVSADTIVTITKPPGAPILEKDIHEDLVAQMGINISCSSRGGHPRPQVRILKGETFIPGDVIHDGDLTRAEVRFEVTAADNGQRISCEVSNPAVPEPLKADMILMVLFPPWDVQGTASPGMVEENDVVSLSCESSSSFPASNMSWWSATDFLEGAQNELQEGAFGGYITRSRLTIRASAQDNRRAFTCRANNGLAEPVEKNITLLVLHAPIWKSAPPTWVDVTEGTNLVVTAHAEANPGPITYTWYRGGAGELTETGPELRMSTVPRNSAGNYSVRAGTIRGDINATFYLNVQYGPENVHSTTPRLTVTDGGSVKLECSAEGNPSPTLTWERQYDNGTIVGISSNVGAAILGVEAAHREDTGVYLCTAANSVAAVMPSITRLIVSQSPSIVKDGGGSAWAALGGNGRLVCQVRAAPQPTFTWADHNQEPIQNSEKYAILDMKVVDNLTLWESVLQVRSVTTRDYTRFHCRVHNAHGTDAATLTLHQPTPPNPPTNLQAHNVTETMVSVLFTPAEQDISWPVSYIVRYKATGAREYKYLEVSSNMYGGVTVGNLMSGVEYIFSVAARNQQGTSQYIAPPLYITTHGLAEVLSSSSSSSSVGIAGFRVPRLILLITTLTGTALLVLNVAIIACFVKRRHNHRNVSNSSSKTTTIEGLTPATTPASHTDTMMPLTSRSRENLHNTDYQLVCQTNIDDCEQTSLIANYTPPITRLQHISSNKTIGRMSRDNSICGSNPMLDITPNGGIPTHNGHSISPSQSKNGDIPGNDRSSVVHTPNPDVCSLSSSTYDNYPPQQHQQQQQQPQQQQQQQPQSLPSHTQQQQQQQQHPQRHPLQQQHSFPGPYQSDDQLSLTSCSSNHSRSHSHSQSRPTSSCRHYTLPHKTSHNPYRGSPAQIQQVEKKSYHQVQETPQHDCQHVQPPTMPDLHQHNSNTQPYTMPAPPLYSSLSPSSLYNLGSDIYDAHCVQQSHSLNGGGPPPPQYATLGTRGSNRRRQPQPQFATLQHPRASSSRRALVTAAALPDIQKPTSSGTSNSTDCHRVAISSTAPLNIYSEMKQTHPRYGISFQESIKKEAGVNTTLVEVPRTVSFKTPMPTQHEDSGSSGYGGSPQHNTRHTEASPSSGDTKPPDPNSSPTKRPRPPR